MQEKIIQELSARLVWLNKFHTIDKITLLNALKEKFGEEVVEIVEKAECEKAFKEWSELSKTVGDNSIQSLINLLWEPQRQRGFEFTSEIKANGIQMRCTKCPIYEMAKEIGIGAVDWMYHHTCCTDPSIVAGFNPKIKLKRTMTLMQGDVCCDHFYYMDE